MKLRTNVYIDGFNFYYLCVKDTKYKWLDLRKLSERMFPDDEILNIRYFTAKVFPTFKDPDKPLRQDMYLRALATLPNFHIHLGRFAINTCMRPFAHPEDHCFRMAEVIDTKEKGSDVNLATYLLLDCFKMGLDKVVMISNDSDLVEPVRIVKEELKLEIVVVLPLIYEKVVLDKNLRDKSNFSLMKASTSYHYIFERNLAKCQLPPVMKDEHGTINKPSTW